MYSNGSRNLTKLSPNLKIVIMFLVLMSLILKYELSTKTLANKAIFKRTVEPDDVMIYLSSRNKFWAIESLFACWCHKSLTACQHSSFTFWTSHSVISDLISPNLFQLESKLLIVSKFSLYSKSGLSHDLEGAQLLRTFILKSKNAEIMSALKLKIAV